jgi:23S rRNA (pseudouridine1915-N3)-methyltransferase
MKLAFWSIGKQHETYVKQGVELFTKRISHYYNVDWIIVAPPKNACVLNSFELKKKEGDIILDMIQKDDFLVLLDEKGKMINNFFNWWRIWRK